MGLVRVLRKFALLEVAVKEQINLLAKIQLEDNILDRLRRQIHESPSKIQESEANLQALVDSFEADKARLQDVKTLQRQCEREVEDGLERIKKSKARLLNIKSNKEFQAALKEFVESEKANREREDKILTYMEELDLLQRGLKDKETELERVRRLHEEEKAALEQELQDAQAQLSEHEIERRDMAAAVDAEVFNIYDRLKRRLNGEVVAWVENATCSACNMNIPPQMYNELQRMDALRFCPNCDRIIYWKNGNKDSDSMSE